MKSKLIADNTNQGRRKDDRLIALQERYAAIFEQSPIAIEFYDLEGKLINVNKACLDMFGISNSDEISGFNLFADPNISPEIKIKLLNKETVKIESDFSFDEVTRLNLYQTSISGNKTLDMIIAPLIKDDLLIGYVLQIQDITESKQNENLIKVNEARFRDLTDMVPEAVFEISMEGLITYANKKGLMLMGYSQDEMKTMRVWDYVHPEEREMMRERMKLVAKGDDTVLTEYRLLRKDGTIIPVGLHSNTISKEGRVVGFRSIWIDLSERKRMEKTMIQAQKMEVAELLIGGITHDFRNILSIILGHVEMLQWEEDPESNKQKTFETILQAGAKGTEIMNQLVAFSKPDKPDIYEKIDLNKFIRANVDIITTGEYKGIKQQWQLAPSLPNISVNTGLLSRVIINLVKNAYQSMEDTKIKALYLRTQQVELREDQQIGFTKLQPGTYVEFMLTDTGSGIKPEHLESIFLPYFSTKGVKGTGLGMHVVHEVVVKQHRGAIMVESEVGKGTTFKIYLPVAYCEAEYVHKMYENKIEKREAA